MSSFRHSQNHDSYQGNDHAEGDFDDRMSVDDNGSVYDYENYQDEYFQDGQQSDSARKRKRDGQIFSLTVPISPKFRTAQRSKHHVYSTEELERERIERELEEQRRERELAEQRKLKAIMSEPYMPARSIKPLTEPIEFHFSTTDRAMQRSYYGQDDMMVEMHASAPKRQKVAPALPEGGVTVPEPFHFAVDDRLHMKRQFKRSAESGESEDDSENNHRQEYVPLAAAVKRIERATPDRWKRAPVKSNSPRGPRGITIPQDVYFHTQARSAMRPPSPQKQEEPKPEPFKARPLNKKIFESAGDLGVPRVEKRMPTIPQSPQFQVNQRAMLRRDPAPEEIKAAEEEELRRAREFKAQPIVRHAHTHTKHVERHMPTIPQSPALSTKERAAMRPDPVELHQEPKPEPFKARPMLVVEQPFVPKLGEPHLTEPEPFDLRTERKRIEAEQKRQERLEAERRQLEEARQFHARPMPKAKLENPFKPHLDLKITEPAPFELKSEQLHEAYQEQLHEKISEEERRRREAMEFRARPFKQAKPFIPQRSTKPLTMIDEVVLNSDERAAQRREFENKLLAKEAAFQEAERKRQILEAERQKQEIKRLREQLVHKPRPIPSTLYKVGFMPRPSEQPLTEPKTPVFGLDKKRRRMAGRDL